MKLLVCSDVHDEFIGDRDSYILNTLKHATADAIILAGDIVTPKVAHRLRSIQVPTYLVLGNHEYYHSSWNGGVKACREAVMGSNVTIVEHQAIVIGEGVRLIGATMWTDFWAPTLVGKEYHGSNCARDLNDFKLIKGLVTPGQWEERHSKAVAFILEELCKPFAGTTIVVTHHAPSFKSNHPAYKNSSISGGFCSELDSEILELQHLAPKYWVHGHTHESFSYDIGSTKVICNPRGYSPNDLNPEFNPDFIIEV